MTYKPSVALMDGNGPHHCSPESYRQCLAWCRIRRALQGLDCFGDDALRKDVLGDTAIGKKQGYGMVISRVVGASNQAAGYSQSSRIRHHNWAMWKQRPLGAPFCWHTACSISLLRAVREYLAWSN